MVVRQRAVAVGKPEPSQPDLTPRRILKVAIEADPLGRPAELVWNLEFQLGFGADRVGRAVERPGPATIARAQPRREQEIARSAKEIAICNIV